MQVVHTKQGMRQMQVASKLYKDADRQSRRIAARAGKAGKTRAAKLLRAKMKIKSREIKFRLLNESSEKAGGRLRAKRVPIPVQLLGGVRIRKDRTITIARWPTADGVRREQFTDGWQAGKRYRKIFRGKPDTIVAQSVARLWVGFREEVQDVMREYQRENVRKWIATVRKKAGAR